MGWSLAYRKYAQAILPGMSLWVRKNFDRYGSGAARMEGQPRDGVFIELPSTPIFYKRTADTFGRSLSI
jgi:hypothetical protein